MKKLILNTACVVACCMGNQMPAKADATAAINKFCTALVELNKTSMSSAAPGTALGGVLSKKDYNGFTYTQLWVVAKSQGTSQACRQMY